MRECVGKGKEIERIVQRKRESIIGSSRSMKRLGTRTKMRQREGERKRGGRGEKDARERRGR